MIQIDKRGAIDFDKLKNCHREYFEKKHSKLLHKYATIGDDREKDFFDYIEKKIDTILVGEPKELVKVIAHIEKMKKKNKYVKAIGTKKSDEGNEETHRFIRKIQDVFNYDMFVDSYPLQSEPNRWGAYQLCMQLNINVCPYCNRQFTNTFYETKRNGKNKRKGGGTRPDLDHFYDKATHPYLALSLYNLIPCCMVCNSRLKGTEKFSLDNYIHPYIEGFGNRCRFSMELNTKECKPDYYKTLIGKDDQFQIKLTHKLEGDDFYKRSSNNIKVFRLEELYNCHKDHVMELIQKAIVYNKDWVDSMFKQHGGGIFQSKEELLQMVLANYVLEEDFDKRVLAKFTKDIADYLGLTSVLLGKTSSL